RPLIGWEKAPTAPPPGWGKDLRWIQSASTGMDVYPSWLLDGAPVVTCARGVSAVAIAEYVMTAILTFEKRWDAIRIAGPEDWRQKTLGSLSGKRLGLAGFGSIGRAVAERALAFGMAVGAVRRSGWAEPEAGVEPFDRLEALVAASDHLVLALPLTGATRGLIGADLLARARPGLHLVNVARGALVDQQALLAVIDAGRVAAATLDVTDPEPLPAGHPFYRHPAIRLTPHVSWSAPESDRRLADRILANLDAYARGEPLHDVVDARSGY
ncbi:NAD(P)-dependent oxidoreductase, partial [Azospirillum sp. B506]|uniref:NAD(P)-dependent oxidoreductase n=1 Tax=Azospirillum sp. B506 TaxID=137721 RepID=UPI0005B2DE14